MSSQPVSISMATDMPAADELSPKPVTARRATARKPRAGKEGAAAAEAKPPVDLSKRTIKDYIELIETVARVEYSRLPNHLIDQSELVNIGAIALHTLFASNPNKHYNVTYLSTAMKWAIRNELRYRYKWYALKTTKTDDDETALDEDGNAVRSQVRESVYEAVLSVDGMMDAENPHEIKDDSYTPEENSELRELGVIIRQCIERLPEREKQIIEARFFKNMKMREIGDQFSISPSRISRIVQAGLDKIKVDLTRRGYSYQ
jgi:RNA polymerase sigma factor (sigma-70 family)